MVAPSNSPQENSAQPASRATEVLERAVGDQRHVVWSGRGVSFALSEAFAAAMRRKGATAVALPASELQALRNADVYYVSRSARALPDGVELLVTQEGQTPAGFTGCILPIPDPDMGANPWLPLAFARATVSAFCSATGISIEPPSVEEHLENALVASGATAILVVEEAIAPLRSLLRAVAAKLGPLPLRVQSYDEIGHGFHRQLVERPASFRLLCIVRGQPDAKWDRLYSWCREVGVATREVALGIDHLTYPTCVFRTCLDAIESCCRRLHIDWRTRPIPESLDNLR